ncbi:hypothetical protein DCS_07741 [Drechmeria coniospora]|uniref:Uncharacterized protein n=1 Tax=Drechmeria coniospora TaxID=98403 RepID=A0A151GFA0_DRECN|nr:hypothetical protein DCS_07741 [Drechmeria coniospora]KYK55777.1 hypothetical protein DCS_07741 [Drechmeria coniospora]ODA81624.1 hypothetical protein RJ55_00125 [Drechmeria coniospora]
MMNERGQNQQHAAQSHHHQAPAGDSAAEKRQAADEPIRELQSISPAIFVPISKTADDLAALPPFVPPANRVAALEATLPTLEAHALEVRANALDLIRRECVRIMQMDLAAPVSVPHDQSPASPSHPTQRPGILAPDDAAAMIANMTAPAADAAKIDMDNRTMPQPTFNGIDTTTTPALWRTKVIMSCVSRAMSEINRLDANVARSRDLLEQALKRERESENQSH